MEVAERHQVLGKPLHGLGKANFISTAEEDHYPVVMSRKEVNDDFVRIVGADLVPVVRAAFTHVRNSAVDVADDRARLAVWWGVDSWLKS